MRVLLLILVTSSLAIGGGPLTEKETWKVWTKPVEAGLGEIPIAGILFKMIGPITDQLLEENIDEQILYAIESGFHELSAQLSESMGRLELAIELSIVKTVEADAHTLKLSMDDIFKAPTSKAAHYAISAFLKLCEQLNPYTKILKLETQMKLALSKTLEIDDFHSKQKLDSTKKWLSGIIHELSLAYLFQYYLYGKERIEEREVNKKKLESKLKAIKIDTDIFLNELLNANYWSKMNRLVEKAMNGFSNSSTLVKAQNISSYVFDIYTKDKLCVVAYKSEERWQHTRLFPEQSDNQEFLYSNQKHYLEILRRTHPCNIATAYDSFITFYKEKSECTVFDDISPRVQQYSIDNGVILIQTGTRGFHEDNLFILCNDECGKFTPPLGCQAVRDGYLLGYFKDMYYIIPR